MTIVPFSLRLYCSFDDGDFDEGEEDEGLDDLENPEDVCLLSVQGYEICATVSVFHRRSLLLVSLLLTGRLLVRSSSDPPPSVCRGVPEQDIPS